MGHYRHTVRRRYRVIVTAAAKVITATLSAAFTKAAEDTEDTADVKAAGAAVPMASGDA